MSVVHTVHLRRIDLVDKRLLAFCLFLSAKGKVGTEFRVETDDTVFRLSLGLTDDVADLHAYTDIRFEIGLDVDLSIFELEVPPLVDTDNLLIESGERVALKEAQEAERMKLEDQMREQFPQVLAAVNLFRRACKVALAWDSAQGRLLTRNIQAAQRHRGIQVNHVLDDLFAGHDTEFLLDAFGDITLTSFTGDADIEYEVSNALGGKHAGVFKSKWEAVHSTHRFPERLDEIQALLNDGWSTETEILLSSLEFLYSENYRMAVLTAATVLEFAVVQFWERTQRLLEGGNREQQEKSFTLKRQMDLSRLSPVEKILQIVLPVFVDEDFVADGGLERCAAAWQMRNTKLAHLYKQVSTGGSLEVKPTEAWDAITSISVLSEKLEPLLLEPQTILDIAENCT